MTDELKVEGGLRSKQWPIEYRTSSVRHGERPVDILHEFYIPVLRRSVRYDRMAGYFSSSSLAASSQGFSAFVGKQGRIRLIVGADLAPTDVDAILKGNQERYAEEIDHSLGNREGWPEDVQRGVDLLAWMVANEYLDIKVAFRIHAETREPIPFLSNVDGYMHEKWAIFKDELDNRLLASGSLNESQRALVHNAENLDIHCDWWGEREIQRLDNHERDFNMLWRDQHPHFRVLTIPEAVRQRLVERGRGVTEPTEIDGTTAMPREVAPPSAEELLKFAIIRDGPKLPSGRYVGMETAPVEPWPHQAIIARRLVETWPYSYMLCDEVGLGKTIEAGLAIRSLYLSGLARRVLVAPPASLKEQWQREMRSKFLLSFAVTDTSPQTKHAYIHPFEYDRTSDSPFTPDLNIVSSAILARRDRAKQVAAIKSLDIVLIDEAHACRRSNPTEGLQAAPRYGLLYQTVEEHLRQSSRALWLATATPMQLEKVEAWDLLRFMNRSGPFQLDPTLTFEYYDCLSQIVSGDDLGEVQWEFLRKSIESVKGSDPLLWEYFEGVVVDVKLRQPMVRWVDKGVIPRGGDERDMARLIFSASPLSRVMLRHTRNLLEIYQLEGKLNRNLARREIQPIPQLVFNESEERAYRSLESYCEELSEQINKYGDEDQKYNVGFYKSFLRLRFASSFYAIQETVRRRRVRVLRTRDVLSQDDAVSKVQEPDRALVESVAMEPEEEEGRELEEAILKNRSVEDLTWELQKLDELSKLLGQLTGPSTKMKYLLSVLGKRRDRATGRTEQTVVFTRFVDTMTEIVRRLRAADEKMLIGTYSGQGGQYVDSRTGQLIPVDREEVKHRFLQGGIDVLICTDAAAEGLNLQRANLIINFDLPWNPMKVEQRIGRLDRIGQKHKHVYVLNLCYVGSAEEIVYGRLLRRLQDAGMIVGTQQISMLPVTSKEFRKLADGQLTETELESIAKQRAREQQERTKSMEIPARDLYEIYMRLERRMAASPAPVRLESIWEALSTSTHLKDIGCSIEESGADQFIILAGIEGVPDRTILTVSRDLYEEGLPGDGRTPHFASYGDSEFDSILEYFNQFDLPECIRRVEVPINDEGLSIVGYAVAARNPKGEDGVHLVKEWEDIEGLELKDDVVVGDDDTDQVKSKLQQLAEEELRIVRGVPKIEQINKRAAHAQLVFSYLIAHRLYSRLAGGGSDSENFWVLAGEMESQLDETGETSVTGLPVDKLRIVGGDLIFEPKIPSAGQSASIYAPKVLLRSALDAARRQADAMRVKRTEQSISMVLNRLERQINEEMRAYLEL